MRLPFQQLLIHINLDHTLAHVPGTVLLDDEAVQPGDAHLGLKHGTGKDAHIVLSPQPSEDPNDPLNWSSRKKELCLAILLLGGMLNTGTNVCTWSTRLTFSSSFLT